MIVIDFTKTVKCPITANSVKKIVLSVGKKNKKIKGIIEVGIIGEKRIKKLNNIYRGIDKTTDVLSFAWQEESKVQGEYLGQIFICYPQIQKQAKEYKVTIKEEFTRMLIHGLLHIIGYDHEKKKEAEKMFSLQEKELAKIIPLR